MDPLSVYLQCNEALETRDFRTSDKLIHDDYRLTGPTPRPLNKSEFLAIMDAVTAACPDFRFNYRGLERRGENIEGRMKVTATHTRTLDLSFLGIPPVEATNRAIVMPEEPVSAIVRDGKIIREHVEGVPGGGLEGFLQQIGVEVGAGA